MSEFIEFIKKAFENDDAAELLCGENGYAIESDRNIPSVPDGIPTDFGRFVSGIFELYKLTGYEKIAAKTREAVLTLIGGAPEHVWCAFNIVRHRIGKYEKGRAPFEIADEEVVGRLRQALCANEDELRKCKRWHGAEYEGGLWQDILRVDGIYKEDMGVGVLGE